MTDAPMLALTFHLSDGSTVAISEPQPLAYLDTLRATLDRRLSDVDPDPVRDDDGQWTIPQGDRVFRVGTDDAGSLIPVGHIVRVTWETVCVCEDRSGWSTQGDAPSVCSDCGRPIAPDPDTCTHENSRMHPHKIGTICKDCGATL